MAVTRDATFPCLSHYEFHGECEKVYVYVIPTVDPT